MRFVIVCNGTFGGEELVHKYIEEDSMLICADGGAKYFKQFGIKPSLLLGDFDSISKEELDILELEGIEILKYPIEKNYTDSELAVYEAIKRGATEIIILGGIGSRLDHSFANIHLLKIILDSGVKGIIADANNEIYVMRDEIILPRDEGYKITLLPMTEKVEGVTTYGLYYPLENATLVQGSTWGVSNEYVEDIARVTIKSGILLVFKSKD